MPVAISGRGGKLLLFAAVPARATFGGNPPSDLLSLRGRAAPEAISREGEMQPLVICCICAPSNIMVLEVQDDTL